MWSDCTFRPHRVVHPYYTRQYSSPMNATTLQVRVTQDEADRVTSIAQRRGTTVSEVIRDALRLGTPNVVAPELLQAATA